MQTMKAWISLHTHVIKIRAFVVSLKGVSLYYVYTLGANSFHLQQIHFQTGICMQERKGSNHLAEGG